MLVLTHLADSTFFVFDLGATPYIPQVGESCVNVSLLQIWIDILDSFVIIGWIEY